MAVSSPISAGAKGPGFPGASLSIASVRLPLRFMLAGMVALLSGMFWILIRPDILSVYHYTPQILAVTHLFTLGWISSIIMGALYQLAPVALETQLYSERLARWQFWLHISGVGGMVWSFWHSQMTAMGHYGSLVAAGIVLFLFNLGKTLARVPRWNLISLSIAAALFWLLLTMLAGLYLAASRCWNFSPFAPLAQMHTHAHLGGLGFFAMLILGISYKLVPMFLLCEIQNERRAAWSVGLLNTGLLGLLFTMPVASKWKLGFAYLALAALSLYGIEMIAIWRARKRRTADWGLRTFFTGLWLLAPLAMLALLLSQPDLPMTRWVGRTENLYGFLALLGLVTLCILGMLYKILPFLVWYASYSKEVGRAKVPAMHELYSSRLQILGYFLFLGGLFSTGWAVLAGQTAAVRWTWLLLVASILVFLVNAAKILNHLFHPKITSFAPGQKPAVSNIPGLRSAPA